VEAEERPDDEKKDQRGVRNTFDLGENHDHSNQAENQGKTLILKAAKGGESLEKEESEDANPPVNPILIKTSMATSPKDRTNSSRKK